MEQTPETLTYPQFVESRFKSPSQTAHDMGMVAPYEAAFSHAAIGLAGELLETFLADSRENFLEELGDTCFFYVALCNMHGIRHTEVLIPTGISPRKAFQDCLRHANWLMDHAKKTLMYRKTLPDHDTMVEQITALGGYLLSYIYQNGLTLEYLEDQNTAKLTKRYATGYSNEAAQQRADKPQGE